MEKRTTARDFVLAGYEVMPAVNGGFIVLMANQRDPHLWSQKAAFSNSSDLLKWLSEGHSEASNG